MAKRRRRFYRIGDVVAAREAFARSHQPKPTDSRPVRREALPKPEPEEDCS